jgi:hypothetical protein
MKGPTMKKSKKSLGLHKKEKFLGGKSLAQVAAENQARAARLEEDRRRDEEAYEQRITLAKRVRAKVRLIANEIVQYGAAKLSKDIEEFDWTVKLLKNEFVNTDVRWHMGSDGFYLAKERKPNAGN